MQYALEDLKSKTQNNNTLQPCPILVDGNYNPFEAQHPFSECIIKGDNKSIAIACASIVAKVYRDDLMSSLGVKYPQYNWQKNAGYPTKEHRDAIKKYGITKHHRRSFLKSII